MTLKPKKSTFEMQTQELNEILANLKKGELNIKEIAVQIKRAKEIYASCKKELEEAKMVINEIKES